MTTTSLAIQNVLTLYQRNLKHGEHDPVIRRRPDFRMLLDQARSRDRQPMMSPGSIRERFGQGAVRSFKSASLDTFRRGRNLS